MLVLIGCSLVADSGSTGERCTNGIDDDFDGRIDCADPDCAGECPIGDVDEPDLLGTCSGTWRSSPSGPYCEPWRVSDWTECPSSLRLHKRTTSDARCTLVGTPCGELPPVVLLPNNLFVDSEAPPGGEGTLESPFASLQRAIELAEPDATIVFDGEFELDEPVAPRNLTLLGLCTGSSRIVGGLTVDGGVLFLENLSLESTEGTALTVEPLFEAGVVPQVFLAEVFIEGSVRVIDGRLDASGTAFIGPVTIAGDAFVGARESSFQTEDAEPCIDVNGSDVILRDLVFDACELRLSGTTETTVTHSLFEQLSGTAVTADCMEDCVAIEDSLFRRVGENTEPAVRIAGGSGSIAGTAFIDGNGPAIRVDAGQLTVKDSLMLQPPATEAALARGIGVTLSGGQTVLESVMIEGYGSVGIELGGGSLAANELILRGDPDDATDGIVAAPGTTLTVDDFLFEQPGGCAFRLHAGATLSVANGMIVTDEAGFCVPPGSYDRSTFTDRITQRTGTPVREEAE